MSSGNLPNKAKYSINWAKSIVLKLYAEYPRACSFLSKYYDVTGKKLVHYLAYGSPSWHKLVKVTKWVDKYLYKYNHNNPYREEADEEAIILNTCRAVDSEILNPRNGNTGFSLLTASVQTTMFEEPEDSIKPDV